MLEITDNLMRGAAFYCGAFLIEQKLSNEVFNTDVK